MTAPRRSSAACRRFLHEVEGARRGGEIVGITDDLSSHRSRTTRTWREGPRILRGTEH
ncbi:hypothetical protein [Kocuria dechangensis]|nr:hypothetical protein [Kocuria dechangensis]